MSEPESELSKLRHAFLEANFGPPSLVIHTSAPESPPLDLAIWAPQARNLPYVTIVTDGLSDQLLASEKAPSDWACERAEVILYLPELTIDPKANQIPWELAFLRMVADLPTRARVPLHAFFTIANSEPPVPFNPNTAMTHAMLLPPSAEAVDFRDGFDAPDGTNVEYLWLDFFTPAEAYTLRDHGNVRLLQMLEKAGHAPPTNFARACFMGTPKPAPTALPEPPETPEPPKDGV